MAIQWENVIGKTSVVPRIHGSAHFFFFFFIDIDIKIDMNLSVVLKLFSRF